MIHKFSDCLSVDDGFDLFAFLHPQNKNALFGKFFDDDIKIILNKAHSPSPLKSSIQSFMQN